MNLDRKKNIYTTLAFLCYFLVFIKITSNITLAYIKTIIFLILAIIFFRKSKLLGKNMNKNKPKSNFGRNIIIISIIIGVILGIVYIIAIYKKIGIV